MSTTVNTSTTNTVTITEKGSSVQVTENSSCPTTTTISPVESTTVTVSENGIAGPVGPPGLITSNTGAVISGNLTASGDIDAGGVISGSGLLISAAGPSGQTPSYDVKFETTTDNDLNVAFEAGSTGQSHFQIKVRDDVDRFDISSDTVNPALSILDDGSIGIGTTSPQKKLDIAGGDIRLDNSKGIFFATLDGNVGRVSITGDESGDFIQMKVDNSNNHLLRLNTTGVGIGTSTPSTKLHVVGTALITDNITVEGSEINFTNLPTSDPGVAGRLWRDGPFVKVSV